MPEEEEEILQLPEVSSKLSTRGGEGGAGGEGERLLGMLAILVWTNAIWRKAYFRMCVFAFVRSVWGRLGEKFEGPFSTIISYPRMRTRAKRSCRTKLTAIRQDRSLKT